jgi:hypothetical protein
MSLPARKPQPEIIVEEGMARLEATVEHIQSDVTEIKANLSRLDSKIDAVRDSLGTKIDALRDTLETLKRGRLEDKLWALLAMAALLGVMARGFQWI